MFAAWGASEWTAFGVVLAPIFGLIGGVLKLARDNTRQHNENRDAVAEKFAGLHEDIRDLGQSVDKRIDKLEDSVVDAIDRHEGVYHRRRRWF